MAEHLCRTPYHDSIIGIPLGFFEALTICPLEDIGIISSGHDVTPRTSGHDAKVVVYLVFSLWHKHFYIGKTLDFWERLRKHIIGFLRPGMARPQPYMTYLTYAACGSPSLALSRTICVPIAMCEDETTALQLEQHLISTVHPR